ncbi:cysteine-rich receptor-like protein kinase 10 [Triticum dicoccoides]|uniref:cysteine-rich receptor-like protein kinase 10 n=1 Tax=Triticum dicoccoides TaxID=85692 RepID=UPI00188F151A|nr:cysteine-rich receptor-like protein kinase 10 [Triticum dicoccoides]
MPGARAAAVLALVLLPTLAAAAIDFRREAPPPGHTCGAQGTYAPGSAYETNLRRLGAILLSQANASSCKCSPGNNAGERPDRVIASAYCYWPPDGSSPDCGACITQAFREAERLCPYHRQAMVVVDGGACSVCFHDEQRMEEGMGVGLTGQFALEPNASYLEFLCLKLRSLLEKQLLESHNKSEHSTQTQVWKSPQQAAM